VRCRSTPSSAASPEASGDRGTNPVASAHRSATMGPADGVVASHRHRWKAPSPRHGCHQGGDRLAQPVGHRAVAVSSGTVDAEVAHDGPPRLTS
jgi:hypothetical protein